jgi:hypothetical protein
MAVEAAVPLAVVGEAGGVAVRLGTRVVALDELERAHGEALTRLLD